MPLKAKKSKKLHATETQQPHVVQRQVDNSDFKALKSTKFGNKRK